MTAFPTPVVATAGSQDPAAPLVVLLVIILLRRLVSMQVVASYAV